MGYLDQLIDLNAYQTALSGKYRGAYASLYAPYEIQTPQTPQPNPYTLANVGYRSNTIIYAAINFKAQAIASAPLEVVYHEGEADEEIISDHPLVKFLKRPNKYLAGSQCWQIVSIYSEIAGFSAWEYELNNANEVIQLWPMRPDWCAFYRGEGKPVRAVRYMPYGLPPVDVPIEKVLLMQYFDPIYPMLKGLSPLGVALNVVQIDNFATSFLNDFMKRGAMPTGILTTDQILQVTDAERIKAEWMSKHGGAEHWSEVAVLGQGTTYQNTGAAFSPGFDFSKIDERDQIRMCSVIGVDPILIGWGIYSKFANYQEARQACYEGHIIPKWQYYASELTEQLLPMFEMHPEEYQVRFDQTKVKALQEDQDKLWTRAMQGWQANLIKRSKALAIIGEESADDEKAANDIYYGDTLSFTRATLTETPQESAQTLENTGATGAQLQEDASSQQSAPDAPQAPSSDTQTTQQAAQDAERRKFKSYAAKRIKEGKPDSIGAFKFQYIDLSEQAHLILEAQGSDTPASFRHEGWPNRTAYP